MTDESNWGRKSSEMYLPGMDLGLGLVYLLLSISIVMYVDDPVTRTMFGLPLILFVPGYTLLVALYPYRHTIDEHVDGWLESANVEGPIPAMTHATERGLRLPARLALSFGISLGLLAPLAIVLSLLGYGFTLETLLGSLSVFATLALITGSIRRKSIPASERFSLPLDQWFADFSATIFAAETRVDTVLNIALTVAVVIALTGFTYALVVPNYGEQYTEFSLVQPTANGQFAFAGYPTEFEQGVPQALFVAVENKEGASTTYTVVVELQRVETVDGTVRVLEREELNRFAATVESDQTWTQQHELTPTMTGDDLRLSYMLYKGNVPASPSVESAYRHLFIWVSVE